MPPAARFIGGVMGFVFGGIGLTVLIFLWASPFDEWSSPPLFFRLFGSFIALAFVAVGGGTLYSMLRGGAVAPGTIPDMNADQAQTTVPDTQAAPPPRSSPGGYRCPNCGAPIGDDADVSPMGDVKCSFCKTWFNVHQRARP